MSAANLKRQLENMIGQGFVVKATANWEINAPILLDSTLTVTGASAFTGVATFTAAPVFTIPPVNSATNAITAFAGGGQSSAVALTAAINRVTIVATIGDSVKLPAATAGKTVTVINSAAANAVDIFPATGDAINALAVNTAVRINANYTVEFRCSVAGTWVSGAIIPKQSVFVTGALVNVAFTAGQITGAANVQYANTAANPLTLTTRTATQMFNDAGNVQPGDSYFLRICNAQGTGVMTIGAGAGVTLTGTMTLQVNTYRDFVVTYTTATALVIQNLGSGPFT